MSELQEVQLMQIALTHKLRVALRVDVDAWMINSTKPIRCGRIETILRTDDGPGGPHYLVRLENGREYHAFKGELSILPSHSVETDCMSTDSLLRILTQLREARKFRSLLVEVVESLELGRSPGPDWLKRARQELEKGR